MAVLEVVYFLLPPKPPTFGSFASASIFPHSMWQKCFASKCNAKLPGVNQVLKVL